MFWRRIYLLSLNRILRIKKEGLGVIIGVTAQYVLKLVAWLAEELKQQSETLKGLSGTVLEDIMIKQTCDAELHKVA